MKLALILLAVCGVAVAMPKAAVSPKAGTLVEAIAELLVSVDIDCLKEKVVSLEGREDGKEVLDYLRGPEFRAAIDAVKAEPAWESLKSYLLARGVDLEDILQRLADVIGIPRNGFYVRSVAKPLEFGDVVDELLTCINTEQLLATLLNLLSTNDEFIELLAFIGSDPINAGYLRLKAHEAIKAVAQKLRENGVEVDRIIELIELILGLGPRSSIKAGTLVEAIARLLAWVDIDCLKEKVVSLEGREDGKEVLDYLRGAEFRAAIDAVKAEPAYASLKAYLLARGVDLEDIFQRLADVIGIPRNGFYVRSIAKPTEFGDVVDELLTCINTEQLLATLLDLLSTNDEFIDLLAYIGNDEINAGYLRLKAHEAIKAVAQKLRENGVDIDEIIALVELILGLGPRSSIKAGTLVEAIARLLAWVDIDCLKEKVVSLEGREDGKEVLDYLRGAEFRAAIDAVKAEPAYASLKAYLLARGVDLEDIFQRLADVIGIPRNGFYVRSVAKPTEFGDVVDELLTCINTEQLLATLLDLLSTNDEFIDLLAYIGSDEINAGYLRLKAHEAIKAVAQKLRENGVDIDEIIALIELILGLGPRSSIKAGTLVEAIARLLAYVDIDCLKEKVTSLEGREDGKEVLDYLRGAEFRAAIDAVKAEPAYATLKAYLLVRGVDIEDIFQRLADVIGIPRNGFYVRSVAKPTEFGDVVDELLTCINTEQLLATLLDLLSTNDEFIDLLAFIGTDDINAGYLRLKAHEAIKAVAQKLRENGVDIDEIIALIELILGLGPRRL